MSIRVEIDDNLDLKKSMEKVKEKTFWMFGSNELWRLSQSYIPYGASRNMARNVKIRGYVGRGEIEHVAPQAHYQYIGKLMIDPATGSSFAKKDAKKVYASPTIYLKYRSSKASREWYKAAWPTQGRKVIDAMQKYIDSGRLRLHG